jgi:CelD/BcsL family acetyltransferase involved in cellulose biosynthesis
MAADYQFERIDTDEAMAALAPEWKALHAESRPHNPFLSWEWSRACRKHHAAQSRLYLLAARREGQLVGLAPLRLERQFGFRALWFLGDGRSDYLGFLLHPSAPDVESALLAELQRRRSEWDLAVLRQLAGPYTALPAAAAPPRLRAAGVEGTVAPYLAHSGDWESLRASGPGWLKRMAKASRKWIKDGGTVERIEGARAADFVDAIAEIEAASWKGQEGVGRFQPGAGRELLREALTDLGALGSMELWLAFKDDRPVAFEINFRETERIWLYQGAYREEYRKYSPGGVLDYLSIENAWRDGAREYDFMSGDEPYKAERTDAQRPIRYMALHPRNARGWGAYLALLAPRWALKGYPTVRAAHQTWVRLRNNPGGVFAGARTPVRAEIGQ